MSIIENKHGHILLDFHYVNSIEKLDKINGIGGGHAILLYNEKLILCWNKYRENWELPGGGKEQGEELIKCVQREINEEINQTVDTLLIKGVSKVFIPRINEEILWSIFYGELGNIKDFVENEEMSKMKLWDFKTNIGDIDEVDMKIIELVLENVNATKLSEQ